MGIKSTNTLTSNSTILELLKCGAHIDFVQCNFSCLLIGRDPIDKTNFIRVDYWDKEQRYKEFAITETGLNEALQFIYSMEKLD